MTQELQVDVAFLGSGVAGYTGAIRARQRGASAAVIERDLLGGTCLNRGCMPAKALIHCAQVARSVRLAGNFGIVTSPPQVEWEKVNRHIHSVVNRLRKGVEYLLQRNGVQVVRGQGRLADRGTIEVEGEGERTVVRAGRVVIATGSAPASAPLPGADEHTITSDHLWSLEAQPRRVGVIGGGFIGCESGYALAELGSRVAIFEMLDHVLPEVEADLAGELMRGLRHLELEIHAPAKVQRIEQRGGAKVVTYEQGGKQAEFEADVVLLAVGRRSVAEGVGAEDIGVKVERGHLVANARMETGVPGVYAIGDVTGPPLLAHAGIAEGRVAAINATGGEAEVDYRALPFCVYTWPELAMVGLTERQARERGLEVRVGTFPFRAQGKAVAIGERDGLVKALVAGERLVGVQIVGPHATELIAEGAAAIWANTPIEQFEAGIRAHPTLAEVTHEAVGDALGAPLHQ